MLDIRYHVVSICAVFFMLGLGILIGEHLAAPAQIKQQSKTLAMLKTQVDGAVQDGREAKRRLNLMQTAMDTVRKKWIPGKLAGKHVVIIQYTDYPQTTNAVKKAINDAGGTVSATVTISDRLTDMPQEMLTKFAEKANPNNTNAANEITYKDCLLPLMTMLHSGTHNTPSLADTASLYENEHIAEINGDITQPTFLFVLVGGRNEDGAPPDSSVAEVEASIVQDLTSVSAVIVGCESIDAPVSSIGNYQKEGIATIDCIDIAIGQFDLPFALRGDNDDYGLKPTAHRQLPTSLEEQTRL